ncbi:hypothetical protein [Candidatus Ichthyocystis sparus]|uniref:hypothetical protein n=1 Tax=Candidatus Ichthyocystis sparus TaxID=1561004 RepID=UPI0011477E47|nr:hypothetical protein [Candidatus Ichthyocystis sparus]
MNPIHSKLMSPSSYCEQPIKSSNDKYENESITNCIGSINAECSSKYTPVLESSSNTDTTDNYNSSLLTDTSTLLTRSPIGTTASNPALAKKHINIRSFRESRNIRTPASECSEVNVSKIAKIFDTGVLKL